MYGPLLVKEIKSLLTPVNHRRYQKIKIDPVKNIGKDDNMSTKLIHKEDRLKNILAVCDPECKGYENLKKMARLGDTNKERIEFLRAFDSSADNITRRTLIARGNGQFQLPQFGADGTKLAMIKPMDKETRIKLLEKLGSLTGATEIIECKTWAEFKVSRIDRDIMKNRTLVSKLLNEEFRKPFTNYVHASDMPNEYRQLHLAYIGIPHSIQQIISSNKTAKAEHVNMPGTTTMPEDYFTIQENEIDVERCDFFDGIITFERIVKEHGLELNEELKEIAAIGKLFESNIHAIALGKEKMYVLHSPMMLIEQWQRQENQWSEPESTLRLHSVTDPAYDSPDTGPVHYIHGVYFPKDLWDKVVTEDKKKRITLEEFTTIDNIEQRRIITENEWFAELMIWDKKAKYTPAITQEQLKNKELPRSKHLNCLIRIPGFLRANAPGNRSRQAIDLNIVNYKDPSTKRVYNSFVPPNIIDPDEAMAWKFHFESAEDYYGKLVEEG